MAISNCLYSPSSENPREFSVINNKVVSANYSIHAAPGDNTIGVLQNTTGDLIIKELFSGMFSSTGYTFKNGKKIEEIEFQESIIDSFSNSKSFSISVCPCCSFSEIFNP